MGAAARDRTTPLSRLPVTVATLLLASTIAGAQPAGQDSGSVTTASLRGPDDVRPLVQGGFDARIRGKLSVAFRLANQRLREVPECAQLFADLSADGLAQLRATRYQSVADTGGDRVCGRGLGAAAFTMVNSPRTIICPAFDRLTVEGAAVILLHEALHSAGQTEWPLDPSAPNSGQLNRMIRVACDL
jgi:hypothetical protein